MPWQRDVLDVALEVDPKTGLLVYREVVLTVPRQSGKTWLLLCLMVHRALGFGEPQRIVYAAQNRIEARKKWEDDFVLELQQSGLRHEFAVRKQIGQEAIRWKNGSLHGITSTTEKAGHGSTLDLAVLDEAFAHEDARLEQALKPTMVTRPEPQMWIVSTAGTLRSAFLRSKVEAGRRNVENGLTRSSFYTEFSAHEDADPADPAVWRECMPALGQTVDEGVIRDDFNSMELSEFQRAYLNQWPRSELAASGMWPALAESGSVIVGSDIVYAVDVAGDRGMSAIGVAGFNADGKKHLELIDHQRGTNWLVPRLVDLTHRHGGVVVVDVGSPASSLVAQLENSGVDVMKFGTRDVANAYGMFLDEVRHAELVHLGQPDLDEALVSARTRPLGDGMVTWARKNSDSNISPIVAATLAGHALTLRNEVLGPESVHIAW